MTQKDKTMSERAAEAQASKTDIGNELGLSQKEVKVITDFSSCVPIPRMLT